MNAIWQRCFPSALLAMAMAFPICAQAREAKVLMRMPEEHPGAPFYSIISISPETGGLNYPHTGEWGAAPFERDPGCVPPEFNLLNLFTGAAFGCDLLVSGYALFDEAGPPPDGLVFSEVSGDGVPIVFARWSEIEAEIADGVMTIGDLLDLPSAVIGFADHYSHMATRGPLPVNQVMFKLEANGVLEDGRLFRLLFNKTPDDRKTRIDIAAAVVHP